MAADCGEENDTRNITCFLKDKMPEDAIEIDSLFASLRAPILQELKIIERVAGCNDGDMNKIARIDEHEEERRKCNAYHRNCRKYRESVSKKTSSKKHYPSKGFIGLCTSPIQSLEFVSVKQKCIIFLHCSFKTVEQVSSCVVCSSLQEEVIFK